MGFELTGDFLRLDLAYFTDEVHSSTSTNHHHTISSIVPLGTIADLRIMKRMVDEKLASLRAKWTELHVTPDLYHEWRSIAGFTAADDIGRRNTMEVNC